MERTDYCEIAKQKLQYFNYSERTIEVYCNYIAKFLNYYKNEDQLESVLTDVSNMSEEDRNK